MKRFAFFVSFLLVLSINTILADKNHKDESDKSAPYFKVYVEDETLFLDPLRSSASIQILDEWGAIVYEEFIPVDQPQLYMIPVDHLPSGSYTVLIVGERMNYMFEFYL